MIVIAPQVAGYADKLFAADNQHVRAGQLVAQIDPRAAGAVESVAPGSGVQFALLPPENATGYFTKIVQRVPVRIARLIGVPALFPIPKPKPGGAAPAH